MKLDTKTVLEIKKNFIIRGIYKEIKGWSGIIVSEASPDLYYTLPKTRALFELKTIDMIELGKSRDVFVSVGSVVDYFLEQVGKNKAWRKRKINPDLALRGNYMKGKLSKTFKTMLNAPKRKRLRIFMNAFSEEVMLKEKNSHNKGLTYKLTKF